MHGSTLVALWLVPLCSVASLIGFISWRRPGHAGLVRTSSWLGTLCFVASAVAWTARCYHTGHLPLFGTFESALSLALAVLLGAWIAVLRGWRSVWPVACAVAAGLLFHGLRFDRAAYPLTISERSLAVETHALLAWAAYGALLVNVGLALRLLVSRGDTPPAGDRALSFSLRLGFVLHTAMLASGSFYKFLLFGRAWSFDPVETLGFVVWMAYGSLLHMHLFAGWSGARLARWCIFVFVLLTVSYRGIVHFPASSTYHIFDMDLRIHITGSEEP